MYSKSVRFAFICLLFIGVTFLSGCAETPKERPKELVTVKVGYIPVLPYAPLFVAKEKGYFEEEGLNVELVRQPSGADILSLVIAGKLQVGGGAVGAAMYNAISKGFPVVVVAPLHGQDPDGPAVDPFVIRKDLLEEGIVKDISDLRGRKVAINSIGVATEFMLNEWLKQGGLTIDDIELVTMPFPQILTALETGAIDAGLLPEPLATLAEKKGIAERVMDRYKPGMLTTVLFFNKEWAEKNPDVAERFMVAYLKAVRDLMLNDGWHSDENVKIIEKYTKVPADLIKKAVPPYVDPNLEINKKSLMEQQFFLLKRGALTYSEPLLIDEIIDTSFAEKAVEKLGRI